MKAKLAVLVIALVVGCLLAWVFRDQWSLAAIAERETELRQRIEQNLWRSVLIGLGVYYVASLIPGTGGKAIVCGWLFGFWTAVMIVEIGLTAAAVTCFYFSRYVVRDIVAARWSSWLTHLDRAVARDGAFYLLTLRMMHVAYSAVNYLAGASRISVGTFTWTTWVGLLPGTMVFVFLGTQIPSLGRLADEGVHSLVEPWLMLALLATAAIPWLFRHGLRLVAPGLIGKQQNLTDA